MRQRLLTGLQWLIAGGVGALIVSLSGGRGIIVAICLLLLGVAVFLLQNLLLQQNELEKRVVQRTAELVSSHNRLDTELTIRNRMAIQLQESETRLAMMMAGADDGFWDRPDMDKPDLWWTPRVYSLLGLEEHSFQPSYKKFLNLCHPHDRHILRHGLGDALHGGQDPDLELRVTVRNQGYRWFRIRGRLFHTDKSTPIRMAGSIKDVTTEHEAAELLQQKNCELEALNTKLRANQSQLVQAEKMSSLGQLAAGIAHEINNPVGYIRSNLGTMQEYLLAFSVLIEPMLENEYSPLPGPVSDILGREDYNFLLEDGRTLLQESITGTERIAEIVQGLKNFGRRDEETLNRSQINEGLEASLRMVWNTLKYKCTVTRDLAELPPVHCNIGRLNQVFTNLLVNAAHAIDGQGEIVVRSRHEDGEIIVEVTDTGCGIAPAELNQVFEPFFTTKPVGQGTGLGLSISHGIVQEHHGTLTVQSTVGQGTTFTIRLPDNLEVLSATTREDEAVPLA